MLTRLELHGFKSFAQKTTLEFSSRIIAIVGPNGSGKSNIIDALRWVLGEREAKQLRGLTLDNLIFAGTPKRPSMGFAKISLYFNNKERFFPVAGSEVVLSRRVDKSGTSSFSLNDEEIRLKDLLPILARAKLGTRGLTMIGQGQSTMFVEASPIERRIMIEEVLGLKEFRLKKHDAERRLAGSEGNLEKVRAMFDELTPHLSFLRRQRKKWEKRAELAIELKNLEDAYYGEKLYALRDALVMLKTSHGESDKDITALHAEITGLEVKVKLLRGSTVHFEEAKALRERISKIFPRIAELERLATRLEMQLEYEKKGTPLSASEAEETLRFVEKELSSLTENEDFLDFRRIVHSVLERIRVVFGGEKKEKPEGAFDTEKKKITIELSILTKEVMELRHKEEVLAVTEREASESFQGEFERLEKKKEILHKYEERVQSSYFEREKIQLRMEEIEREWLAFGREKDELPKLSRPTEKVGEVRDNERHMFRLRGQLAEVGDIDATMLTEAEESEKRHEFLSSELRDVEMAVVDLKKLIRDLDAKIKEDFEKAFQNISDAFQKYFSLMFGGGRAKLKLQKNHPKPVFDAEEGEDASVLSEEEEERPIGVEIEVSIPKKKITNLGMLSGGEKSLVSLAALFALISVSPPPFLVLDEIDAALDEVNARRFSELVKNFSTKSQFIIVTHNRATMEAAEALYGVTMADDGVSKLLSMKFDDELTQTPL